jgi:hypothetical protein
LTRHFHNRIIKLLSFPVGMSGKAGPGNGHRCSSGFRRQARGFRLQKPRSIDTLVELAGRRGSPRAWRPPPFHTLTCSRPCIAPSPFPEAFYSPIGWQQYSRPLWLSRLNHYILYLKAMTAQMPTLCLFFHSNHFIGLPAKGLLKDRLHGFILDAPVPGRGVRGYVRGCGPPSSNPGGLTP